MLKSQTWDFIMNQLRQYDRSETNLKQESLSAAYPIICHSCHAASHKNPDCPMRALKGGVCRIHKGNCQIKERQQSLYPDGL